MLIAVRLVERNTDMDNIAYISFEHDLEDGWYRMREPSGKSDTWGYCGNAVAYCEKQGWQAEWVGNEYYKPKDFPASQKESN